MEKISADKAAEIVKKYDLKIYKNIWHYSFNDIFKRNFFLKEDKDSIVNLFSKPLNDFCPALIYTNDINKTIIKTNNLINGPYDSKNDIQRRVFWYLRTNSFQNFLERNTKRSPRRAHERFPTSKSYPVYKEKYPVVFEYSPFDEEYFIKYYNKLKLPEHLSAEGLIDLLNKNNPGLPQNWLRTATLIYENEVVAISSLIDDKKTIFADNIATKRTKIGFGIYLFTELIRYACENEYYSFDGGVTSIYGVYKGKIFLDSSEVIRKRKKNIGKYFKFWKISYWKKIKQKLITPNNDER